MSRPIKYRAWAIGKMRDVRAISFTESGEVHRILDTEGVQRVPEALLQFTGLRQERHGDIPGRNCIGTRRVWPWPIERYTLKVTDARMLHGLVEYQD